jgi:hypothetical protein
MKGKVMKALLFLLALVGCASYHPIQYQLYTKYGAPAVMVNGPDDNIDVVRARAFDIAKQTCGYDGRTWSIHLLEENTVSHTVVLIFICHEHG